MGHTLAPTGKVPGSRPKLDEILESAKEDVEDAIKYMAEGNEDLLSYKAPSKEAGDEDMRHMRAYARQREPRVIVYGNVSKDGVVKFRVTPYSS